MRVRLGLVFASCVSGMALLSSVGAVASAPAAQAVSVPPGGTYTYTGTIPVGSTPTSDCNDAATADHHTFTISVAPGYYQHYSVKYSFSITWNPSSPSATTSDEILTVNGPPTGNDAGGSEVGSSDSSATTETVVGYNLQPGQYDAIACGYVNAAPQDYTGKLVVTKTPVSADTSLPSAPSGGLAFSAAVPADAQRDEAEPNMEIDRSGKIYTCGPTGFSNAADYAQVSTDFGDQFHLLGTPPRGQQGAGGGGDCAFATGLTRNPLGAFQYAYSGLGALSGFTTATSPNEGHSIATSGYDLTGGGTSQGALADRQWMVFTNASRVLLSYNQQEPRNTVVLKSTDGGLHYSPLASIAAPNPRFPGPLRYGAGSNQNIVIFPWDAPGTGGDNVNLSISKDGGSTWTYCRAAVAPANTAGFVTADVDTAGNVYIAYAEEASYHTYMVTLPAASVGHCTTPVSQTKEPINNIGFSAPTQVDRNAVRTTVFPWVAAGGVAGRVAVAFYGTTRNGDPNTGDFKAAWNVYVNQSQNALSTSSTSPATFSQVRATTHPFHYDSICLNGLGCDLSTPAGDRSLADFFAMSYNRADKRLSIVFNRTNKKPDESTGHVATPMVITQGAGPSNGGGAVSVIHPVVATDRSDPAGDALSSYSVTAPEVVPPNPPTQNEAALDFRRVEVLPLLDLATRTASGQSGFTVRFHLAQNSLSTQSLTQALADTGGQSLLWVFRFTNGYQDAAVSARWNPTQGFTYGYNDYTTGSEPCQSLPANGDKCVLFPGSTPVAGTVGSCKCTMLLNVPASLLRALGPNDQYGRPTEVAATTGSRFYDAEALSYANNASPTQDVQSFLYPLDNTPAMDFLLPSAAPGTHYPDPAVLLAKSGPVSARAGASITYTLSYANLGPNAANVAQIIDRLPTGESFVSASAGGTYNAGTRNVTWDLGTVAVAAHGSVTLTVKVAASVAPGTPIVNHADFIAPATTSPATATVITIVTP